VTAHPAPAISARLDGEHVVIEDFEVGGEHAELLRSSKLTGESAVRFGRELIRLGMESMRAAREAS